MKLLLVLAVAFFKAQASGNDAIQLHDDDFEAKVKADNIFVLFSNTYQGDRDVSPEFQELYDLWNNMAEVSNLDGSSTFKLATVDCKINSKLCQHQGITDPVAVKFFNNGVKDAKSNDMMPFFKSTIQEEIDRFLLTEKLKTGTHVVQFYTPNCPHCKALKPIWTRFTKDYDTNENISLLKCNCKINRKLCSKFGISKYPCVYKFEDGKLTVKFEGSRTEGELKDFIEKAFIQSRSRRSLPVADPYKSSSANELEISETDFDKVIAKDFTCVLFYISGCAYCKDIIKTWGRLADYFANNDTIKIGRVNCMSNYDLCSKDSNGSPTVNMYGNGALMRKDWHEDDSLKALIKFVECYVAGGEVLDEWKEQDKKARYARRAAARQEKEAEAKAAGTVKS